MPRGYVVVNIGVRVALGVFAALHPRHYTHFSSQVLNTFSEKKLRASDVSYCDRAQKGESQYVLVTTNKEKNCMECHSPGENW